MSYRPRRGDFGAEYASDLIPLVEASNCIVGCIHSGGEAARQEFGPGGTCSTLARLFLDDEIPELTLIDDGPILLCLRCTPWRSVEERDLP